MDFHQIRADLDSSPALRLIRSDHAPFIVSFFYNQYKQVQHDKVSYQNLVEALDLALEEFRESEPGQYPRRAQEYLKEWIDSGYLREYTDAQQREKVVELTPHSERVLRWLDDLRERQFIGTESRLLRIFALLEDIAARSSEDATLRLQQLERQRAEIDAEIEQIRETGKAERLTGRQIREWFLEAESTARQMIGDFREVEGKFRVTAREVYSAQLDPNLRRGDVLGSVLHAESALRESDQGRSFYAFYEFLTAVDRKDQFQEMLSQVYALPDLEGIARPDTTLRHFIWNMVDAAQKVRDQNNRLIDQLRRLLDSRALQESRRVRELIDQIKRAAIERADSPPTARAFIYLDDRPLVQLPMDRELWKPTEPLQIDAQPLPPAEATDWQTLREVYGAFYIDEKKLRDQIDSLLDFADEVTLQDVLERYPLKKGIPEFVAYLNIAMNEMNDKGRPQHDVDLEIVEPMHIERYHDKHVVTLHVPHVTFRR